MTAGLAKAYTDVQTVHGVQLVLCSVCYKTMGDCGLVPMELTLSVLTSRQLSCFFRKTLSGEHITMGTKRGCNQELIHLDTRYHQPTEACIFLTLADRGDDRGESCPATEVVCNAVQQRQGRGQGGTQSSHLDRASGHNHNIHTTISTRQGGVVYWIEYMLEVSCAS